MSILTCVCVIFARAGDYVIFFVKTNRATVYVQIVTVTIGRRVHAVYYIFCRSQFIIIY